MTNVIETAVAPMKAEAMNRAEKHARELVAKAAAELAQAGFDLNIVAPYPKSWGADSREYNVKLAKYRFFGVITTWRAASYRMNEPHFADINAAKVEKLVADAREDAAFQYEAFVAKLNSKIGPATAARLEGNHVWGHSYLHVTTAAGEQQIWKTQMIINVSKLGKIFNQFPTRKVKAAR